jgi:hypothetical protein
VVSAAASSGVLLLVDSSGLPGGESLQVLGSGVGRGGLATGGTAPQSPGVVSGTGGQTGGPVGGGGGELLS